MSSSPIPTPLAYEQIVSLTDATYRTYALKNYRFDLNPAINVVLIEEFDQDLDRITLIKKLFYRYHRSKNPVDVNLRVALNHIITFANVFGVQATINIFLYKFEACLLPILKTFLVFLQYVGPDFKDEVMMDLPLIQELRKL